MNVTHQKEGLVSLAVFGEFTLADIKEFEDQVNFKARFEGATNLFVDLRQMAGYTLDVALEEIKFSRSHARDFARIAILTSSQWVRLSAWLTGVFLNSEVAVFEDEAEARAWLEE